MPKIEISFDELITITAALRQQADDLSRRPEEAKPYKDLWGQLHDRFAKASTQEDFERHCREAGINTDGSLIDAEEK